MVTGVSNETKLGATASPASWVEFYPVDQTSLHGAPSTALKMFQNTAMRDPQATAIIYFDITLSYQHLDHLSEQLAHYWMKSGISDGDRIAIILQNVPQFVIALVAAWKLGSIPVTINPMYRAAELARLFADCEPSAILCHDDQLSEVVEGARGLSFTPQFLTTSAYEFQRRNDDRVLPPRPKEKFGETDLMTALNSIRHPSVPAYLASSEDIALLLYTSGTTGVPKAAMLTHRNVTSNAAVCRYWFGLSDQSRIFGIAPLFHITGFEVHVCAAFISGASVILTYRFTPSVALDAFKEHRPTFTIGAITAFSALMHAPAANHDHFGSFAHIYSGGAPIPPPTVAEFERRFGKKIRTSYGMTETTAPTHLSPPEGTIPVDVVSGALAIGVPVPGTEARILDEHGRELPIGGVGELAVRGNQVMKGYWRKPHDTAAALIDGWMHTGDVAFRDAAGWFYLVDRKKDMINASGFKVWPREVEDVLYLHRAVREAAVIGVPDSYRGESVAAFVSLVDGTSISTSDLIGFCRTKLAAYKCPRTITFVDELPKTVTGKIRRAELRVTVSTQLNLKEQ